MGNITPALNNMTSSDIASDATLFTALFSKMAANANFYEQYYFELSNVVTSSMVGTGSKTINTTGEILFAVAQVHTSVSRSNEYDTAISINRTTPIKAITFQGNTGGYTSFFVCDIVYGGANSVTFNVSRIGSNPSETPVTTTMLVVYKGAV